MLGGSVVAALLLVVAAVAEVKYDGYHLVRVRPQSRNHSDFIRSLLPTTLPNPQIRLLNDEIRVGRASDLLLAPQIASETITLFKSKDLSPIVITDNIQSLFDAEKEKQVAKTAFKVRDDPSKFPFDKFNPFDSITNWLKAVEGKYNFAKTFQIGTTFEKRPFFGIKIGKASKDGQPKKGVWIDGGIHAREWMAPATIIYIINELTSKYGNDQEITDLVDGLDFYLSPNLNPDGYVYTFSDDRMWRKTRSTGSGSDCVGVDPNRNFDWHWDDKKCEGASDHPCAEDYRGPAVYSEPECKGVADLLFANNQSLKAMITTHTYGNVWLVPYGFCLPTTYPPDYKELLAAGQDAAKAIADAGGPDFEVGNSATILYPATGASDDFSKGAVGIKYVYTVELGDSFTQPDTDILQTASSTWAGYKVIAKRVMKLP